MKTRLSVPAKQLSRNDVHRLSRLNLVVTFTLGVGITFSAESSVWVYFRNNAGTPAMTLAEACTSGGTMTGSLKPPPTYPPNYAQYGEADTGVVCVHPTYYYPIVGDWSGTCPTTGTIGGDCLLTSQPTKNYGNQSSVCALVGDPVNVATGNLFEAEEDYIVSGPFPISLVRYYNSKNAFVSAGLGMGWTYVYGSSIKSVSSTSVEIAQADGKVYTFNLNGSSWSSDPDVNDTLVQQKDSSGNITGWTYTQTDGTVSTYSATGQLLKIKNRAGLTQTLTYSTDGTSIPGVPQAGLLASVTDSFGRKLQFTYVNASQIATVITPNGTYSYAYDSNGNLSTVTAPDSSVRTYLYENSLYPHALTGIVDANGQRYATYQYDADGNTTQSGHADGADQINLSYNGTTGTTVTNSLGAATTYTYQNYNGVLKNTQVQEPCIGCGSDNVTQLGYDSNGNLTQLTDQPGDGTAAQNQSSTYDAALNLPTAVTEAAGSSAARTTHYTWDSSLYQPTQVAQAGLTTSYTYNTAGEVHTRTEQDTANNLSRTWTVDTTYSTTVPGAVVSRAVTGPRTDLVQTTTTDYYAPDATCSGDPLGCRGMPSRVTNALGQITTLDSYNANGRPLQLTDPNGRVTQLAYNAQDLLTSVTIGQETTAYQYDAAGNLTQVTRPDGSFIVYRYDTAHRLTDIVLQDGSTLHYTLNTEGKPVQTQVTDASGTVVYSHSNVYDTLGRLQQSIGAYNQSTADTRDAHNNLSREDGPRTDVADVVQYQYDTLNRLITLTQADGGVQSFTYDALDHVTGVTDPNQQTTAYTLDAWGDRLTTVSQDTGTTTAVYDNAGNKVQTTDALGNVTSYTYDALNRVTGKQSSVVGTPAYTYVYDTCTNGIGRLCGIEANGTLTTQFGYDSQGRLASRQDNQAGVWKALSYTYQPGGQLASVTYPSGNKVQYQYDSQGHVSEVDAVLPKQTVVLANQFAYQPFGSAKSFTFGNGLPYYLGVDLDYRPVLVRSGPWQKSLSYDAAGNISVLLDINGAQQSYTYDADSRLLSAANTAANSYGTLAYQYDKNSNRTQATQNGSSVPYTYSPPNWLAQQGTDQRTRNAAGYTSYTTVLGTLTYDGYGHLTQIDPGSASQSVSNPADDTVPQAATYSYDGFGERIGKQTADGVATDFGYGPGSRLLTESSGGKEYDYVWLNGQLLARLDKGPLKTTVYYYHTDTLGTPQAMTNAAQQVVWQANYTPYGQAGVVTATVQNNVRLPGQYHDRESGLKYNVNRDYDAAVGRYVQPDPLGLEAGPNIYAYVGGNPVNDVDPLGLATTNPFEPPILNGLGGGGGSAGAASAGGGYIAPQALPSPQRGLPLRGPSNGAYCTKGGNVRIYGPNGDPLYDLHQSHYHDGLKPHSHNWSNGQVAPGAEGNGVSILPGVIPNE